MAKKKNIGLGDKIEEAIKTVLPKVAEQNKDCEGCKNRKIWLNNFGAIFSYGK